MRADFQPPASCPLTLRLLGPFEAQVEGQPLRHLRTRKGAWLLAILALRAGRQVERSWLETMLWSESPERQAAASLRKCLADLRSALGRQASCLYSPAPGRLRLE